VRRSTVRLRDPAGSGEGLRRPRRRWPPQTTSCRPYRNRRARSCHRAPRPRPGTESVAPTSPAVRGPSPRAGSRRLRPEESAIRKPRPGDRQWRAMPFRRFPSPSTLLAPPIGRVGFGSARRVPVLGEEESMEGAGVDVPITGMPLRQSNCRSEAGRHRGRTTCPGTSSTNKCQGKRRTSRR
jgi:hypothetical protein